MEDLKNKAKAAFDFTKTLNKVFMTADGVPFILETDAKMHIKDSKLEDKTVTPFTRDEVNDIETLDEEGIVISNIEHSKTVEEAQSFVLPTDTREAVVTALNERIEEINAAEGK